MNWDVIFFAAVIAAGVFGVALIVLAANDGDKSDLPSLPDWEPLAVSTPALLDPQPPVLVAKDGTEIEPVTGEEQAP